RHLGQDPGQVTATLPREARGRTGEGGYPAANPLAISSALRIRFSEASGVRNALCADSVTFGSVVSSCPAGSGSWVNTSNAACLSRPDRSAAIIAASSTTAP